MEILSNFDHLVELRTHEVHVGSLFFTGIVLRMKMRLQYEGSRLLGVNCCFPSSQQKRFGSVERYLWKNHLSG